jgi:hypothetical protein
MHQFCQKMRWNTFWATFSQTHLVALVEARPRLTLFYVSVYVRFMPAFESALFLHLLRLPARVARFFLVHDTKTGKMYQMNTNCYEWS